MAENGDAWGYRVTDVAVFHGAAYRQGRVEDPIWPRIALVEGENMILVHPDRLEDWYTSRWTFRWRDEPFEARGLTEQGLEGVCLDDGRPHCFPLSEVSALIEHREQLMPRFRREQRLMADAAKYRSGTYARHHDRVYPAGDAIDDDARLTLAGPEQLGPLSVTLDELDEWYSTVWTFRWRGEPFEVADVTQGRFKGLYLGGETQFALDHLQREPCSRLDFSILLPEESVEDLTEHRVDLLAPWREKL